MEPKNLAELRSDELTAVIRAYMAFDCAVDLLQRYGVLPEDSDLDIGELGDLLLVENDSRRTRQGQPLQPFCSSPSESFGLSVGGVYEVRL